MGRVTARRRVTRIRPGRPVATRADALAVEEPLEVRLGADVLTVTMRTPGDDIDLVAGWLVSEGLARTRTDLARASYCPGLDEQGHQTYNVVEVVLTGGVPHDRARRTLTSSACGVCGSAALDAVRVSSPYDVARDGVVGRRGGARGAAGPAARVPAGVRAYRGAARRGAVHARRRPASACARTSAGTTPSTRSSGGRCGRTGCRCAGTSCRSAAARPSSWCRRPRSAGIPVLSAVSAPSSLAADLAEECGLTLAGFVRDGGFNLYARPERVRTPVGR